MTGGIEGRAPRRAIQHRADAVKGIDGKMYPRDVEDELNGLAHRVLGTADGQRFLAYLRGITIHVAFEGNVEPHALMHMEGQRWLVGLLISRSNAGSIR
jgi:hypothetical protein